MFDLIIRNGTIIDGSGEPACRGDVGIWEGRIAALGDLSGAQAPEALDAEGRVVAPGFIDMHSHGDLTCFIWPRHENYLRQGVTTYVGGNCGLSAGPIMDYWPLLYVELDLLSKSSGVGFDAVMDSQKMRPLFEEHFGVRLDWETFPQYLDSMDRRAMSANLVPVVGQGQLRAQILGYDFKRPADSRERGKIAAMVEEALEAGAFGISTGLDYAPGIYADDAELAASLEPAARRDALYLTHWKRTGMRVGTPRPNAKIEGIQRELDRSLEAGIRLQLSHLASGYDIFPRSNPALNRAGAKATTDLIDAYNARGGRVAFDVIPNTTGGLGAAPALCVLFSKWLAECGGHAPTFGERLRDKAYRQDIADQVNRGEHYELNPRIDPEWSRYAFITHCAESGCTGRSIHDIARDRGVGDVEAALELIALDWRTKVDVQTQRPEVVEQLLSHPLAMPCSDCVVTDDVGPWASSEEHPGSEATPNGFCYAVRYLKHYSHPSPEWAVRRLTGLAADTLGLADRGYLREGAWADIVVFDPGRLQTNESRIRPRTYAQGFDYVLVNGTVTLREGEHTGAMAGKVIRRKK